jgi:hypothetical protein
MRDLGALTAVDTVKEMKGSIRDFLGALLD